uniref:Putative secreted protein n=1 Tax=Rhipicephalus microplus TaxID=6941 RepID=A0A6M2DB72_RHIMP
MSWCVVLAKLSASVIMRAVRSSSCVRASPRSVSPCLALMTSPASVPACALMASMLPVLPGMWRATVFDGFPLASPKSSSRSSILGPPPNRPLKKPCFGASGISLFKNMVPSISCKLAQKSEEMVNFCNSDGEHKNIPCPFLLKQKVLAILMSTSGRKSVS